MKVSNLLRTFIVFAKSLGVMCRFCVEIIYLSYQGRLTRKHIDSYALALSTYVTNQLHVTHTIIGLDAFSFKEGTPYIFMSNHVSLMDILLANFVSPPSLRFLAKKELSYYPLLGSAMQAGEYIFIDRKNLTQAKTDLERAKTKLQSGIKLWIFPEGTRSRSGKLLPFKKGGFHLAIEMKATIIPVGFQNVDLLHANRYHGAQFGKQVTIKVGEPIDASSYSKDTLLDLIARTEQAVAQLVTQ